ncbi:hypothetical protein B296_00004787 [Ensete ventricosum]|uniref:Uncharacterized protein n=1 Tax=Ensete ventricosum TaxID=4639 RepID=A0A426ZI44_ENSVE|nr:hypothetical protein B296_00004787 [Ensete ventricosum]
MGFCTVAETTPLLESIVAAAEATMERRGDGRPAAALRGQTDLLLEGRRGLKDEGKMMDFERMKEEATAAAAAAAAICELCKIEWPNESLVSASSYLGLFARCLGRLCPATLF